MSTVSAEDPCSPFVRHDGTDVDTLQPPQRPSERWGEYDVRKNGRDCRHSDGFSRFRTNFDCCHEVPIESQMTEFEGQMLPKPFQENVTCKLHSEHSTKRRVPRVMKYEVFPQHDSSRADDAGDFMLSETTRDAINSFHNKLHRASPRYGSQNNYVIQSQSDIIGNREKRTFNDTYSSDVPLKRVRFADDINQPLESRPVQRVDLDFLTDPSNWPNFDTDSSEDTSAYLDSINDLAEDHDSTEESNRNQNFHNLLLPDIYKYRLPSTFHYDQFYTGYLNTVPKYRTNELEQLFPFVTTVQQPAMFPSLMAEKDAIQRELQEKNRSLENDRLQRNFPRPIFPGVDDWVNSSEQLKLKLSQKAVTQRMYNLTHPEDVPDLRDFATYSKRVFFNGYNSSVFR